MSTATEAPPGVSAQQHSPLQGQAAAPVSSSSVGGDSLTCQWANCGERCASAENLYDHVCERHVGRKSTNNLNLTCQWGNCRTTTVKRDHITSHIRVHVPLKPHKCDFCGKAFKRPQDLKKHVKTHADDSVLLRSPEPNRAQHGGAGAGAYPNNSGKLVADLQSLAATASGYYPDTNMGSTAGYGYQNPPTNAAAYGHSAAPQGSAYGQVYYAVNQSTLNADYEMRKRAAFDALNEFFGDAKRRVIDPTTYYDVGQRLMALQSAPLPILGAYQGGMSDYQSGPALATHPVPQHQYSLPLPNLRTKNDLVNIDQFLEQLQSTVYENPSHAAAAGVAQPGSHYVPSGLSYRTSHSPPSLQQNSGAHVGSSHANAMASLTTPASTETPALTPASSVLSYTSGQSPNSGHSAHTISPVTRTSMGTMYPTLPSVSAMADMSGSYATTSGSSSSAPPPSGLATAFDHDGRRRYSGGLLQKAAQPRSDPDRMDLSDDSTPTPKREGSHDQHAAAAMTLQKDVDRLALASPNAGAVDPALRSPGQRSSDGSSGGGGAAAESNGKAPDEAWVENIRIIEALRQFVKERLEKGEFEEEGRGVREGIGRREEEGDVKIDPKIAEAEREARELYPVLRAVQDA